MPVMHTVQCGASASDASSTVPMPVPVLDTVRCQRLRQTLPGTDIVSVPVIHTLRCRPLHFLYSAPRFLSVNKSSTETMSVFGARVRSKACLHKGSIEPLPPHFIILNSESHYRLFYPCRILLPKQNKDLSPRCNSLDPNFPLFNPCKSLYRLAALYTILLRVDSLHFTSLETGVARSLFPQDCTAAHVR